MIKCETDFHRVAPADGPDEHDLPGYFGPALSEAGRDHGLIHARVLPLFSTSSGEKRQSQVQYLCCYSRAIMSYDSINKNVSIQN